MTSKSNETKNPQRGEEQHQHHKNPSEGSPKQVPPLGVLLRFLTSQVAYAVVKTSGRRWATCSICPLTRHRRELKRDPFRTAKKKTASHINEEGQDIEGDCCTVPLGKRKNPHDAFVNLDGAINIAVRSSDPLAD